MKHNCRRPLLAALATGALMASNAFAQAYPNRPITFVYPYAAGSGPDTAWRTIAAEVRKNLGQPVVYDNRPGAGGRVGLESILRSAPDGYSLSVVNNPLLVTQPIIDPPKRIDAGRDYAPIIHAIDIYQVLVINPSMPFRNVAGMIAYAKANPGKLNYGSAGIGVQSHVGVERFKAAAGIDVVHVTYKGEAPAVADVASGQIQFGMPSASAKPLVDAGRLIALATTGARRWHIFPDLPTLQELGFKDYESATWMGVVAPAGTPAEVVARVNAAVGAALKAPEARAKLQELGFQVIGSTPEQFTTLIRNDLEAWGPVLLKAGIKPE